MGLAEQGDSERLPQITKEMQRHRFGRRPDTLLKVVAYSKTAQDVSARADRETRVRKRRGNQRLAGSSLCNGLADRLTQDGSQKVLHRKTAQRSD